MAQPVVDTEELDFYTELALHETQRWIETLTRKKFKYPDDVRRSLEDGTLFCELLNSMRPSSIHRINRLPSPIAGLDNINVFLQVCKSRFGLQDCQLFHSCDLEDLSRRAVADSEEGLRLERDRRLRNVAITIFWLGRVAPRFYDGPKLDLSAFSDLVQQSTLSRSVSHQSVSSFKDRTSEPRFGSVEPQRRQSDASEPERPRFGSSAADQVDKRRKQSEDSAFLDWGSASLQGSYHSDENYDKNWKNVSSSQSDSFSPGPPLDTSADSVISDQNSNASSTLERDSNKAAMPGRYRTPPTTPTASWAGPGSLHSPRQGMYSEDSNKLQQDRSPSEFSEGSESREYYDQFRFGNNLNGSQGRSSSTDSMDSQQTDSTRSPEFVPPSRVGLIPRAKDPTHNPLQFIASQKHNKLAVNAKTVLQQMEEQKKKKVQVEHEQEDWQSNLTNWKDKMRRKSAGAQQRAYDAEAVEEEDHDQMRRKNKTFREIMEERERRKSGSAGIGIYPDDDEYVPSTPHTRPGKDQEEEMLSAFGFTRADEPDQSQESDVAPWAENIPTSQSVESSRYEHSVDTEDNTRSFRSDSQSAKYDDENSHQQSQQLWRNNGNDSMPKPREPRVWESKSSKMDTKQEYYETPATKWNNHISSSTERVMERQAFKSSRTEEFVSADDIPERYRAMAITGTANVEPGQPIVHTTVTQSQTSQKTEKRYVEKTVRISMKPNNPKRFGFTLKGGREEDAPIIVDKVSLGSAADVCELHTGDEILAIDGADVTNRYLRSVQHVTDNAVATGQLELRIRRNVSEDEMDDLDMSLENLEEEHDQLLKIKASHMTAVSPSPMTTSPQPLAAWQTDRSITEQESQRERTSFKRDAESPIAYIDEAKEEQQILEQLEREAQQEQEQHSKQQESDEDEPPPLPAQPPPPVNWNTFPSAASPPSDSSARHQTTVEQPVSPPMAATQMRQIPVQITPVKKEAPVSKDPTVRIRTDIMRKKSEFLGLNVEETNEYKTFTEEKEKETRSKEEKVWESIEKKKEYIPASLSSTQHTPRSGSLWQQVEGAPSGNYSDRTPVRTGNQFQLEAQEHEIIANLEREERELYQRYFPSGRPEPRKPGSRPRLGSEKIRTWRSMENIRATSPSEDIEVRVSRDMEATIYRLKRRRFRSCREDIDWEEEKKRMIKWHTEQEKSLQEKYARDQERLQQQYLQDLKKVSLIGAEKKKQEEELIERERKRIAEMATQRKAWEEQEQQRREEEGRRLKEEAEQRRKWEQERKTLEMYLNPKPSPEYVKAKEEEERKKKKVPTATLR